MHERPELDLRTLPPSERQARVFEAFDAIGVGASFVLVDERDPKPLFHELHARRAGRFEWNVLEAGPERFRVEVQRRAEAPRGVTELLEIDHRRLDALLADARTLASGGSFEDAAARFAEFRCGLDRHIDVEEKVLFPVFEDATGMTHGPTAVMRHEHVQIRRGMADVSDALARRDADGVRASIGALEDVLSTHNLKEERVLYPMTDEAVGDDRAREELVRQLQAY
ncbi:MAG TPA: hemerythrin domain-containing protein [Sandaracinaceae bacterium]